MKHRKWIGVLAGAAVLALSACGAAGQGGAGETPEDVTAAEDSTGTENKASGEESTAKETAAGESDPESGHAAAEEDTAMLKESSEGPEDVTAEEDGRDTTDPEKNSQHAIDGGPDTETGQDQSGPSGETIRFSILGDSLSTYEGWIPEGNSVFYPHDGAVQDVSQTWWKIVLDETGFELCTNGSSSGSTCIGDSRAQDVKAGCSDLRISQLSGPAGEEPDLIIVYMGTNDMVESVQIGDNDGRGPVEEGLVEDFSDAYTLMLDKLTAQYPSAQIYCCTLLPLGNWGKDQPFVTFVNGLGLTSEAYSNRISVIAKNRGLPVIDLYHCGITIENMPEMSSDGVHLTPAGMRCVADAVLNGITE